jgi:hypothetical protein
VYIASRNKIALHCIRLDCNAQPYSCIATDAGGWQLPGVAPYWVISFEITQGISVLRLSQKQCEGGGV